MKTRTPIEQLRKHSSARIRRETQANMRAIRQAAKDTPRAWVDRWQAYRNFNTH